jgi:hypothetical protein
MRYYTQDELNAMNPSNVTTLTNSVANCVVRLFDCPRCESVPGRLCLTTTGMEAGNCHRAREDNALGQTPSYLTGH